MRSFAALSTLLLTFHVLASEPNQVQVQGHCDLKVIPDRGMITFTAENQSKDQAIAVKKTNEQIESLKADIKELKLKDLELKNTSYQVYPVREYEKDKIVEKGFRASLALEVITSEIAKIGEAIVKASKNGITNVGNLNTFLSLEKNRSEYLKCLDVASEDARKKAEQLAKKLSFKLGEVIKVVESPMVTQPPHPYPGNLRAKSAAMMDAAPIVEAGTQQFSTDIQVSFSIK